MPSANGISKLFNQINELAIGRNIQRNHNASRIFIDHAIDSALAVRPLNQILTNSRPRIPIHFSAADRFDCQNSPVKKLPAQRP
jgi:hypothetical protein